MTQPSWEQKALEPHQGSLVGKGTCAGAGLALGWGLRDLAARAALRGGGGGQCSQLISGLSGRSRSELISFVERDNESVFWTHESGEKLKMNCRPPWIPSWTLVAFTSGSEISGKEFSSPQHPYLKKTFLV